jgi:hypothetical protein
MVMPALTPRATPVRADDTALLHVLKAYIETLKAENEILKRRLADAEARAARETAKANRAIAEFPPLRERLTARAANRAKPWWRRLVRGPNKFAGLLAGDNLA